MNITSVDDSARRLVCRGTLVDFLHAPAPDDPWAAMRHIEDGAILVDDGLIAAAGPWHEVQRLIAPTTPVHDYRGALLLPGFVDAHVHYVQMDIVASYGHRLLDWLENYTYPAERRYADPEVARHGAERFLDALLRNGTTTALVMGSVHRGSAEALFHAARTRRMRLIAGQVMMDRNCPDDLRRDAADSFEDAQALIERWHGVDRLGYAVTPRFAPTSSAQQLDLARRLLEQHDGVLLHSHLAENAAEVAWVAELFPDSRSYLDVYARHGLVGERSVFAHCLHLDDEDRRRFAHAGATAAMCPTSNLFLGSGLFDLQSADRAGMRLALGTDIGAGTSFSLLRTQQAAYGVTHLGGDALHPARAWYLATLGGAASLGLADKIGNLLPGKEADFIVLDPAATELLAARTDAARSIEETLFALTILGDDRAVRATYVLGKLGFQRP